MRKNMTKSYLLGEYDEWAFIEDNLPNYHQRDDVLYNDIVSRYVNGEELSEDDLAQMKSDFPSVEDAEKWLDADIRRLFLEAVEVAYNENRIMGIELFV